MDIFCRGRDRERVGEVCGGVNTLDGFQTQNQSSWVLAAMTALVMLALVAGNALHTLNESLHDAG